MHTTRRAAVLLGAAALTLTACTGGTGHAGPAHRAAVPAGDAATASAGAWRDPAQTIRENATRLLADTGRHTGAAPAVPLPSAGRGTEYVAIECRGAGSITVDAGTAGTYRMPCAGAGNGDELDDFRNDSAFPAADLKVTAAGGITWQVAVGWSAPGAPLPTRRATASPFPTPRRTARATAKATAEPEPTHHTAAPAPTHHTSEPEPEPTHHKPVPAPVHHTPPPRRKSH